MSVSQAPAGQLQGSGQEQRAITIDWRRRPAVNFCGPQPGGLIRRCPSSSSSSCPV